MTLDFDNDEQYRKFVKDVAENIYLYNPQLFHEEVADYVVDGLMGIDRRRDLAEAILQQLLNYYSEEANHEQARHN